MLNVKISPVVSNGEIKKKELYRAASAGLNADINQISAATGAQREA